MSIYKPCDIRGDATRELSPSLYRHWGRTLGQKLPPMTKFVVGGDTRASTPAFLEALVEGLCQAGLDVVDIGILPTPMVYYAQRRLQAGGCAVVTASHNPASANGLKWLVDGEPPTSDEVASMATDKGTVPFSSDENRDSPQLGDARPTTVPRSLDVSFDYVACLQEQFVDSLDAQLHVVIDPMHGCWAGKARRYLHAVFPQCLFSSIHDRVDPKFGGRAPDCSDAVHLAELGAMVYRERAHLGIAFDGDGDRIAIVDGSGVAMSPEETVWTLLNCLGAQLPGERFVHDLKFSDRIIEAARQFGAETLAERSGHGFLRAKMRQSDAVFGAEISGHYFYRALGGGDDGLFTACLLIAHLAHSHQSLADLRGDCPTACMTPDLRLPAPFECHCDILERLRAAWSDFPQRHVDGLRVETPSGWALARSSITEPAMTFRFEGLDWNALEDLVERFCDTLPDLGDTLWLTYRKAIVGMDK